MANPKAQRITISSANVSGREGLKQTRLGSISGKKRLDKEAAALAAKKKTTEKTRRLQLGSLQARKAASRQRILDKRKRDAELDENKRRVQESTQKNLRRAGA